LSHSIHPGVSTRSARRLGLALAGAAALGLAAWSLAAQAVPEAGQHYRPIQSISYDLGSKRAVGYFERRSGQCHLVMMVAEASDPGAGPTASAARLRLDLTPGQRMSLDSDQGGSLDVTCGADGETLLVTERVAER